MSGAAKEYKWNWFIDANQKRGKTKNADTKRILSRRHFWLWKERTNGKSKNNHKILNAFLMQNVFVTRFTMMNIVKRPNFVVGCCKVLKWKTVRLLNRLNRFANAKNSFSSSHRPRARQYKHLSSESAAKIKIEKCCVSNTKYKRINTKCILFTVLPSFSAPSLARIRCAKCREKRRWSANGPPNIIHAANIVASERIWYALNERNVATRN